MRQKGLTGFRAGVFLGLLMLIFMLVILSGCISSPQSAPTTPSVPLTSLLPDAAAPVEMTVTTTIPATTTTLQLIQKPSGPAEYRLTFKTTWSNLTHPTDFPENPHFSGLIGATHKPGVRLWKEGELATKGIEAMAEDGVKPPLSLEIDSLIASGGACTNISGGGVSPSPGIRTLDFTITPECTYVSVVSMIAPSPDWFVGVSDLDLNDNGEWADKIVVELPPYDAGTDLGPTYTSPDEDAENPVAIRKIDYEPLLVDGTVAPMGTFTFMRLDS
ncbi:MAG: spondin domain-containing protein [Candidatus Hydrothermarchaeales archaeon]